MHSGAIGRCLHHGLKWVVMGTKKDAQGSVLHNGKGINAADTSYAGKVAWSLAVWYSLFPTTKSGALCSSHCRKTRVGSEIYPCRAAAEGLQESVLLIQTPARSEWHGGAPNADLGENYEGSKEGTCLSVGTWEHNPLLLPYVLELPKFGTFPTDGVCSLSKLLNTMCQRLPQFAHKHKRVWEQSMWVQTQCRM